MPATATAGRPLVLFLSGVMTEMNYTCLRAIPLNPLLDMVVCERPGHGISCKVDDVSPVAMAREYAALIDRYVPSPQHLCVIGESFGGLIGAALAELRPDRVDRLVLLDTPFCLTRLPLAAMLSTLWLRHSLSRYPRRIFLEAFGFGSQDGTRRDAVGFRSMLAGLHADCTVLAGCEEFVPVEYRSPSHVTNADLAWLRAYEQVTVLRRIESAGHCLLPDNPGACVAALTRHMGG